jgi:hypothetical protein
MKMTMSELISYVAAAYILTMIAIVLYITKEEKKYEHLEVH